MYLLGYVASIESYEWLAFADPLFGGSDPSLIYNSAGAMLVVSALIGSPGLSKGLSGRVGRVLGRLSFPMYLVHLPILMSLSGTVLLWTLHSGAKGWVALHITLAATLLAVLLISIPLAAIDTQWVRFLNWGARRLEVGQKSERGLEPGVSSANA
jgi:peptidoglycan/LPS O-acetylase OafA/YrhL